MRSRVPGAAPNLRRTASFAGIRTAPQGPSGRVPLTRTENKAVVGEAPLHCQATSAGAGGQYARVCVKFNGSPAAPPPGAFLFGLITASGVVCDTVPFPLSVQPSGPSRCRR